MRISYLVIIIFVSTLMLQGCLTTAIISTAAISTKIAKDPRTLGTQIDDNTLEFRINTALFKDNQLNKKTHISALAYQGKVLLVGQSPSFELSSRAENIATNIKGTTVVFNEIRQDQPVNLLTNLNDTWVTTKVRFQLLVSDQINSSNIKVITENSEIFLIGLVNELEGKIAADIASHITEAKRVTTAFIYMENLD